MTEWQQHMARLLADKGDAWFRHEFEGERRLTPGQWVKEAQKGR